VDGDRFAVTGNVRRRGTAQAGASGRNQSVQSGAIIIL
jgi:hypothetical protein